MEDTVDYNNIKEVVVNDYHFSYLFFVQPNYAISDGFSLFQSIIIRLF